MKKIIFVSLLLCLILISGCNQQKIKTQESSSQQQFIEANSLCNEYFEKCDIIKQHGGSGYIEIKEECENLKEICLDVKICDSLKERIKNQMKVCNIMAGS